MHKLYIIGFLLSSFFVSAQKDSCLFHPLSKTSVQKNLEDISVIRKNRFYSSDQESKTLLSYVLYKSWGSCNDEGIEVGGHEWKKDSLIIYTYWCYAGDPSGHDWGGRIMIYKWDCTKKAFLRLSSRIYIETMAVPGGKPLYGEDKKDAEAMKQRKEYIQQVQKEYHAAFVSGKQADELVERAKQFLQDKIDEATKDWEKAYGPGGGAGSGFGYRK